MEIGLFAAFGAGLLSFLSPCILPIVPFYLTYLAGQSVHELEAAASVSSATRRRLLAAAVAFSLGLITVFVVLGLVSTSLGQLLRDYFDVLRWIAAVVVLVMGLQFLGVVQLQLLKRQIGGQGAVQKTSSLMGAYVLGLAFAFGWTPCVGPILAAILFLAAGQDQITAGATLLTAYGLGMTLPFILAAAFVAPFLNWASAFRRYLPMVERIVGLSLVVFAMLIASDSVSVIAYWMLDLMPEFGRLG